jgi:hypothetical protein
MGDQNTRLLIEANLFNDRVVGAQQPPQYTRKTHAVP